MTRTLLSVLAIITAFAAWPITAGHSACLDRPACHGCGCKGGPGYRGPDRHCVGFKQLDQVCGNPPSRCIFENAPGTGANRECALAPRPRRTIGDRQSPD